MDKTASKKLSTMAKTASKKPSAMDKTKLKKCILAIDLGSTALRAAFVECEAPYTYHPIQNRDVDAVRQFGAPVTCRGDFPVSCCPLRENPFDKIGADAVTDPGQISAKYLMYILAKVDDSVMADYPLPADILAMKDDDLLLSDCRTILAKLFSGLKDHVDDFTGRKRLCFDEIVLTIPSQWNATFENVYTSIIEDVFSYENEDGEKMKKEVHYCGEADALARYVILNEENELEDWEVVLFLDFGGHSMSYSLMELKRTKNTGGSGNSNMTFFELGSGGCAGGSEMWSHQVRQLISEKLEDNGVSDPHGEITFQLLQNFNTKKGQHLIPNMEDGVIGLASEDEQGAIATTVNLPRREVKRCFDAALKKPFAMAKRQLKKLKGFSRDYEIGVVVAGGTLMSTTARRAVFADSAIPEERIKYTADIDVIWLSSCNCHGAALAHAKKMTVAQFFANGAVIALQRKVGRGRDYAWEHFAYLLVGNDKKYVASVYNAFKGTQMRLVCNPTYFEEDAADKNKQDNVPEDISESDPNTNVKIPMGDFYDLHYLGSQRAGRLIIEASLTSPSGTASPERTLHVSISHKSRRDAPKVKVDELNLPLCLDPGHNAVHVDIDTLGSEVRDEQAELRQREGETADGNSGSRPSSSRKKSATSNASRTKRKREDTDAAPDQPSKRPRTRAAPGSDDHVQLDNYGPPGAVTSSKRKATAAPESSTTATKKARIATSAKQPNTKNIPDNNQSDETPNKQTEEQPQERSDTQDASQHNDEEDTNLHTDDQPDNELDQNHDAAATESRSNNQQPSTPPYVCPTCQKTFVSAANLRRHSKLHTGEKPYSCSKCGMRFSRGDYLREHTRAPGGCTGHQGDSGDENNDGVSTTGADESGVSNMHKGASQGESSAAAEERRSSEHNSSNNNSNLNPNNNGNTSRSTRNQTAENARGATATRDRSHAPTATADRPATTTATTTTTTTHTNSRFVPRSSPPKSRRRHQTESPPEQRLQPQPQAQAQPQPKRSPRKQQQQKKKAPAVALTTAATRQQQQARPQAHAGSSRFQAQAQQALKILQKDEEKIADSITVKISPDPPNSSLAGQQVVDEDEAEEEKQDEGDDEDDYDNGGNGGDDDDDGDDHPSGSGDLGLRRIFFSSMERERENLGRPSSPILGERGKQSSGNEGNAEEQDHIPGPLSISRLQRTVQAEVRASSSPQRAHGGSRAVGAAGRNKENRREQIIGTGTVAAAAPQVLTEEGSRRRPTREEKGKGKAVDEPVPKPKPATASRADPHPLVPRMFYGQVSSGFASSSSSGFASSSSSAPAPTIPSTTTTTTTGTSARASSSTGTTIPATPRPTRNGRGKAQAQTKAKETVTTTRPPFP
ncbi:unnamed protein product [Sordaria macrospora k-hell]|uniref:WGS project CABT00000000 data, contig 2.1 n=1 Tax=Sordaria macrospora (strain ATCC MYA-333 / DSM 997 / K(L3346) / K-hell) TaxID=771870 RepID=F7VK38_SORMK|nr:uncharacterized protein SMAC_00081 [Sordaria macrospora k-hell]CCC05865.1 unnamed protein product [Sordaria macrospora k-hell]